MCVCVSTLDTSGPLSRAVRRARGWGGIMHKAVSQLGTVGIIQWAAYYCFLDIWQPSCVDVINWDNHQKAGEEERILMNLCRPKILLP